MLKYTFENYFLPNNTHIISDILTNFYQSDHLTGKQLK